MKQFGTIFRFEFKNYVKSKSFLILTILLVVGIAVALSIPRIKAAFHTPEEKSPAETTVTAVAGKNSPEIAALLLKAVPDVRFQAVDAGLAALKKDVADGKYESAVYLTGPLSYTRVVKNVSLYDDSESSLNDALVAKYRTDMLEKLGVSDENAQKFLGAHVESQMEQVAGGKDQTATFFYTYILIFALYMAIMVYGQFVASSVATEKSTRAMELLITSTDPNHLIFGKVFGAGTAGLTQFVLIFGSGYLFYNLNAEYYGGNSGGGSIVRSIFDVPLSILLYAILFFILGFFIYAFLYGALGSLVSRMEELNSTVMPVSYLFLIAFFIVFYGIMSGNVDNTLMKVCSFIPFTSPMAMFVRIAMSDVPGWEVAVSIAILVVSTAAIGFLAAAIYRIGVLLYGKAPKPREIVKMLRNSR